MLNVYADFARNCMAMPVIRGEKTEGERFPGAVSTLCIEAMMQDRKALQAGTSHFLGQNFSRASGIEFLTDQGEREFAWTTSWGVSTRLIGGLIMTHSDDDGLVLPPRLAPVHIVILPVIPKDEHREQVLEACHSLETELKGLAWEGKALQVHVDDRDLRGGEKMWSWVKKGVPVRVEIGPRDLEKGGVFMARRDTGEKQPMERAAFVAGIRDLLEEIQSNLFQRALDHRRAHSRTFDNRDDFYAFFQSGAGEDEPSGGFAWAHWAGGPKEEEMLQKELKVTVRCIPYEEDADGSGPGTCPFTGKESPRRVVFARAY